MRLPIENNVLRLIRVNIDMNPCLTGFDSAEPYLKSGFENLKPRCRVVAFDVNRLPFYVSGILDRLCQRFIVCLTTVCR